MAILGKTNDYRRGVQKARSLACSRKERVTLGINDERHPYAGSRFGPHGGKAYVIYTGSPPPYVRPGVGVNPNPAYCSKKRRRTP